MAAPTCSRQIPDAAAIFLPRATAAVGGSSTRTSRARSRRSRATAGTASTTATSAREMAALVARANGGFFTDARSRGAARALGRADQRHLSRRHDLRDAAADPGLRGAADAEPARAVRAARASRFLGPDHVHLMVQAKQIAYHDRDRSSPIRASPTCRWSGCSPRPMPTSAARLIDPARALPWDRVPVLRQPGRRHGLRRRGRRARATPPR